MTYNKLQYRIEFHKVINITKSIVKMSPIAVVLGGSGTVGSGAVYQFLKQGFTVIVPLRNNNITKLNEFLGEDISRENLHTPSFLYSEYNGCKEFANWIKEKFGVIDHVFASCGSLAPECTASGIETHDFNTAMLSNVLPHIYLVQNLIPLLRDSEESSYSLVTGFLGENCCVTEWGLTSICDSACFGFSRAMDAEFKNKTLRFNEFRIRCGIHKFNDEPRAEDDGTFSQNTRDLAKYYYKEIIQTKRKTNTVFAELQDILNLKSK